MECACTAAVLVTSVTRYGTSDIDLGLAQGPSVNSGLAVVEYRRYLGGEGCAAVPASVALLRRRLSRHRTLTGGRARGGY